MNIIEAEISSPKVCPFAGKCSPENKRVMWKDGFGNTMMCLLAQLFARKYVVEDTSLRDVVLPNYYCVHTQVDTERK